MTAVDRFGELYAVDRLSGKIQKDDIFPFLNLFQFPFVFGLFCCFIICRNKRANPLFLCTSAFDSLHKFIYNFPE